MKNAVLMVICAFALCSCGLFGKQEPRHMTTPAQWEKYGFKDHLQETRQDSSTATTAESTSPPPQKADAKPGKKRSHRKSSS